MAISPAGPLPGETISDNPRYQAVNIGFHLDKRRLTIAWADGQRSLFPYIWLRLERLFPLAGRPEQEGRYESRQPEDAAAMTIAATRIDAGELVIEWRHDDTPTRRELAFLRNHCLSDGARRESRRPAQSWSSADARTFSWFDGTALEDPQRRLEVFLQLRDRGIVMFDKMPVLPGSLRSIATCFGPVRNTHFDDLFDIRSLPADQLGNRQNIGATACNTLSPHTDEGWRHGPPGISLIHWLRADPSGGGASIHVDGFGAALALRESDTAAFEFLASVSLTFAAERNSQERFRSRARVIALGDDGIVRGIRVTDRTLLPPGLPADHVEFAYRAIGSFYQILLSGDSSLEQLLQPGEMVAFDNHRVLHVRRAFAPRAGERWIQQLSIDREEFHNRFRQLAEARQRFDISYWEQDAGALSPNGG